MAAEEFVGVRFGAETLNARTEIKKLNQQLLENQTAAQGAGTEQKKLGAAVNDTKAQQREATEAVRRAKEAQQEHNLTVQSFGPKSREAAESAKRLAAATEESKRAAVAAAKALGDVAREATQAANAEGDKLTPATRRAAASIESMGKDAARTEGELRRLDLSITAAAKAAEQGSKSYGAMLSSFAGNVGANALGAVTDKLREGAGWVLETGSSYETLRVALETTTGSAAKAASEFERLQAFAASTPYGVAELTESFIKLGNRGIVPTDRLLTAMGNTASAMGKTLDDFTEAIADAVTGENERLKEFGIVGKKSGDTIAYTFRGVTTEVKMNADAITEYLTQIGENNFAGGMDRQSRTLAGMWSTMMDNASALADEFVQGLAPALKEIMEGFGGVDEEGRSWAKGLGEDVGAGLKTFVTVLRELLDTVRGDNGVVAQLALLGGAAFALGGPFAAAAAAGLVLGNALSDDLLGATEDAANELLRLHPAMYHLRGETFELAGATKWAVDAMTDAITTTRLWETASRELTEALRLQAEHADFADTMAGMDKWLNANQPDKKKKGKKGKAAKDVDISSDSDRGGRQFSNVSALEDTESIASQAVEGPRAAALAEQEALAERRLDLMDREIEALDAKGAAERQQVDLILWQLDIESDAERQRAELQDERLKREATLARWQVKNARDEETRAKALTRLEDVEHKKRVLSLERANAAEEREQAKKLKLFNATNNAVQTLGATMIDALEAQAKGEKHAVAKGVAAVAEGVRNKMILKALEETALGIAAAAGIVTAGFAPPHFVAAGVATAAALAAQGVASAFNAVAGSGSGGAGAAPPSLGSGAGGSGGASSSGGRGNDKQEVPVSHEQTRRDLDSPAASGAGAGGPTIVVNMTGIMATDDRKMGAEIQRVLRAAGREGQRF